MADVLSQSEIDALISTYKATGEKEVNTRVEKEVRLYDFARPDKFSKDHIKSLNIIHTKHGSSLSASLGGMLRTPTQIDLLAVDQLTYREYCASVADGTLFVEVSLDPFTSTAVFEFSPAMVSSCVDLMAGGNIVSAVASELTEIDKAVMKPILDLALKKYSEAWSSCVTFHPHIVSISTESNTRQILLPSEAVLVCGYEVSIGGSVSMMSICIPAVAVEAVLPALTVGRTLNSTGRRFDGKTNDALKKSFQDVSIECHATLGKTTLTLGEIVNLEIGDLICLPTKADGQVKIWIENVAAFEGDIGLSGKNLAFKVSKKIAEPFE